MSKRKVDWGAWLSMAAIGAVCVAIVVAAAPELPSLPDVPAEPESEEATTAPAAAKEKKAPKKDEATSGINAPEHTYELEKKLDEISGLALTPDGKSLWAVDDEKPTLFRISLEGKVEQEVDLGKRGDYESVEEIDGLVYVVRSDGIVLIVDPDGKKETEKLTFTKQLGVSCDVEGTAFQKEEGRVLFSCKNEGMKTKKSNRAFEIYAMDLKTRTMKDDPAIIIEEKELDAHGVRGKAFAPSAMAVHPKTHELWMLSSRGKMLVVVGHDGKVKHAEEIDAQIHRQPEGLAFSADGSTMYVSDEAHGKQAMLHVVKPKAEAPAEQGAGQP